MHGLPCSANRYQLAHGEGGGLIVLLNPKYWHTLPIRLLNLELWNRLPGTREDGTIDLAALKPWIKEARSLAKAAGRGDIADSHIGAILSASPNGTDGIWPAYRWVDPDEREGFA